MPTSASASRAARRHSSSTSALLCLVGLLDAVRVDSPVEHQLLEREPADLAADRVEARQQHGLGRVVDDHVDAGDRFEGPDVAALAADDAALHLVAGQVHDADHGLGGLLAGHPLHRLDHDRLGPLGALGARLVLDGAHQQRGVAAGAGLDAAHQLGLGLLAGQSGHSLELALVLDGLRIEFGGPALELAGPAVEFGRFELQFATTFLQRGDVALQGGGVRFDRAGPGLQPRLRVVEPGQLAGQVTLGVAQFLGQSGDLGVGAAASFGQHVGGPALGSSPNPVGLGLGRGQVGRGRTADGLRFGLGRPVKDASSACIACRLAARPASASAVEAGGWVASEAGAERAEPEPRRA